MFAAEGITRHLLLPTIVLPRIILRQQIGGIAVTIRIEKLVQAGRDNVIGRRRLFVAYSSEMSNFVRKRLAATIASEYEFI